MHVFGSHRKRKTPTQAGFALIVVLSSLLILTGLFAIAQARSMTALGAGASEKLLLQNAQRDEDLLQLAIAYRLGHPDGTTFEIAGVPVLLQDVGGLIDLNTAAPELLDRLATGLGISSEKLSLFRTWRRTPHRLLSTADFSRLTGLPVETANRLSGLSTVYSGRIGIAPETTPTEVWKVIGLEASTLPAAMQSPPANAVFAVFINRAEHRRYIGTIEVGASQDASVILP